MATQVQRTAAARRRLIAATRELVAAHGVSNTSVAAIGARAGMSRGAVNFHFGSKDDLLVAVFQQVTSEWEEQVLGPRDEREPFADADELIDCLLDAWLGELGPHPDRVRIVVMLVFEALGPSPHLHEHFVALRRRFRSRTVEFVTRQQAAGRVSARVDPDGFASLLVGMLLGIAVSHLADADAPSLSASIDEAREALRCRLHA